MAIPTLPCWIPEAKLRRFRSISIKNISRSNRRLDGLIHVVGASGQEVPFLGYVELDIGFPCVEAGTEKVFSTLVLVVLDKRYNQRVPLILGTNLGKKCRDDCQQKGGQGSLRERNISDTWKRAYCALSSQEKSYASARMVLLRLDPPHGILWPSQRTRLWFSGVLHMHVQERAPKSLLNQRMHNLSGLPLLSPLV